MPRKAKSKSKGSKYSTKRKIKSSKSKSSRKNKTRNYESDSSDSFMKQLVSDMDMTTEQSVGGFDMQQPMMNNMMQQPMNHGIDPLMVDEFAPLDNNMNNVMSGISYQNQESMPMQMPQQMMSPQMPQMPQMMSPQMMSPQMMPQQMPQMMPQQMPQQMPQMMGGSRKEHKRIMRNIRRFFS